MESSSREEQDPEHILPRHTSLKVTSDQTEEYTVGETFHAAQFDAGSVAGILQKQKSSRRKDDCWDRVIQKMGQVFEKTGVMRRVVIFILCFLVVYYVIQACYQSDVRFLCPDHIGKLPDARISTDPKVNTTVKQDCRTRIKEKFGQWNKDFSHLSSILTFLLGFYASGIVGGWMQKVMNIPDIESTQIVLGGLISPDPDDPDAPRDSLTSALAAVEVQKMIARYCLLSWTLCYNTFSHPLADNLGSVAQMLKKKLLTKAEVTALQADNVTTETEGLCSDKWWVPLSWAVNLINQVGQEHNKEGLRLIPKDRKGVLDSLVKFKDKLDSQKCSVEHKTPLFYKRAVHIAIYTWVFIGVLGNQDTSHWDDSGINIWVQLLFNFPAIAVLVLMVLLGWLAMADTLENPYGYNKYNDINLTEELEVNIWRSSLTIQNLTVMPRSEQGTEGEREEIQRRLWGLIQPGSGDCGGD